MILQLNPTILVETPLGRGHAIFIIDYGMHQNTCWVVALQKDGVVKHFDCNDIIISTNFTYGVNLERHTNHACMFKTLLPPTSGFCFFKNVSKAF